MSHSHLRVKWITPSPCPQWSSPARSTTQTLPPLPPLPLHQNRRRVSEHLFGGHRAQMREFILKRPSRSRSLSESSLLSSLLIFFSLLPDSLPLRLFLLSSSLYLDECERKRDNAAPVTSSPSFPSSPFSLLSFFSFSLIICSCFLSRVSSIMFLCLMRSLRSADNNKS